MPRFKVHGRSRILWIVSLEADNSDLAAQGAKEYIEDMLQVDGLGNFQAEVTAQEDVVVYTEEEK